MKLKNYKKPWTQEDIDYLEWFYQNPEEGSIKSVAEFLGRTPESVKTKYYELRKQGCQNTHQVSIRNGLKKSANTY
ncbi:hypothetical protein NENIHHPF_00043 [Enterococcus phage EF_FB]